MADCSRSGLTIHEALTLRARRIGNVTKPYVDMLSAGIVDPAKVVRVALQDAASVAGLMITTEAMVAEHPKKEAPAMPG